MWPVRKADNLPPFGAFVTKSGKRNCLEHSVSVQWGCFTFTFKYMSDSVLL